MEPNRALQLALGHWPARAFTAAAELGILELLERSGPMSAAEIAAQLGLRSPSLPDLLDALVALGVLSLDGEAYGSSVVLDHATLAAGDGDAYRAWADLPAALRGDVRPSMFERLAPDEVERFASAMAEVSAPAHPMIAELVSAGERVCDVGGGDGRLAAALAARGAVVTTYDRPALADLARARVPDGVTVVAGDFFTDDLPTSDTAVLCMVLLDWDVDAKRQLLARVAASTRRILVVDRMGMPERPTAAFDLLRSLHLLVTVGDAHHYRADELATWLGEVGCTVAEPVALPAGLTLVEGRAG